MTHTMNLFDPKSCTSKHTLYDPWSTRRSLSLSPRTYLALERLRITLEHQAENQERAEDSAGTSCRKR